MGLVSRLFRSDAKLQACLVDNAAHLTRGAQGDHVGRVQYALFALDRLKIDRQELVEQSYGESTAQAVLSYKSKREIINRSYENAVDDIVGKMTIASLDNEMRKSETHRNLDDCRLSPPGAPPPFRSGDDFAGNLAARNAFAPVQFLAVSAPAGVRRGTGAPPQLNRALRIFCAITRKSALEDGFPILPYFQAARDMLFEHGMTLSVEIKEGFADTLNVPDRIVYDDDVARLRKASEDMRPGLPGILRVIVCQTNLFEHGQTKRNIRSGDLVFPPFVLLNSLLPEKYRSTLLHEMIHAANSGPILHDSEQNSVFFDPDLVTPDHPRIGNPTWLPPKHAAKLAKSFFAV